MRITLTTSNCIGSGTCALTCPEVFGQDDDGTVVLLDPDPPQRLHARVHAAEEACPTMVIEAHE